MIGCISHMCISVFATAIWTISLCRILLLFLKCAMFVMSSQVAAHTTATSATDPLVRFQGAQRYADLHMPAKNPPLPYISFYTPLHTLSCTGAACSYRYIRAV